MLEKLAAAARTRAKSEATLARWRMRLLNDDGAIEAIESEIESWGSREHKVGKSQPRHEALTYIENHREQMRYASVRAQGLPIGSGSVESTCKQLVAQRFRYSGQRWSREGAQAILNLRVLHLSQRWDGAMELLRRAHQVEVTPLPAAA